MKLECCSCKKLYDPDKVPKTQIGFCSDGCLRYYLWQIDDWFEDIKTQLTQKKGDNMPLRHTLQVLVLRELMKSGDSNFVDLLTGTKTTPGNLSSAINRLIADKYVDRTPTLDRSTRYCLTNHGKMAYKRYVKEVADGLPT